MRLIGFVIIRFGTLEVIEWPKRVIACLLAIVSNVSPNQMHFHFILAIKN